MIKHTNDKAAAVDTSYPWLPIDKDTPRGTKLQLIRKPAGVAQYGKLGSNDDWFTHWAPLPTFKE